MVVILKPEDIGKLGVVGPIHISHAVSTVTGKRHYHCLVSGRRRWIDLRYRRFIHINRCGIVVVILTCLRKQIVCGMAFEWRTCLDLILVMENPVTGGTQIADGGSIRIVVVGSLVFIAIIQANGRRLSIVIFYTSDTVQEAIVGPYCTAAVVGAIYSSIGTVLGSIAMASIKAGAGEIFAPGATPSRAIACVPSRRIAGKLTVCWVGEKLIYVVSQVVNIACLYPIEVTSGQHSIGFDSIEYDRGSRGAIHSGTSIAS